MLFVTCCGALAASAAVWAQRGSSPAPTIDVPERGAALALLDFGGRAVVDAKINGHGPYRFVLGTAATITIVDAALYQELKFPAADGPAAAPVRGQTPLLVTIDELRLAGVTLRKVPAAVLPLSNFQSGASLPRGILNASLFQGYLLTFNYPRNRALIEKGQLDGADAQSTFEYAESRPMLPVTIAGAAVRVRVDTGSSHGLTLPARFQRELPLASPPDDAGKIRTVAGDFSVAKARVKGALEIGAFRIETPEVYFNDAGPGAPLGNVGYEVLRNFVVTLDAKNRRIRLQR